MWAWMPGVCSSLFTFHVKGSSSCLGSRAPPGTPSCRAPPAWAPCLLPGLLGPSCPDSWVPPARAPCLLPRLPGLVPPARASGSLLPGLCASCMGSALPAWAPPLLPGLRPSCPGSRAPPARAPRLLPALCAVVFMRFAPRCGLHPVDTLSYLRFSHGHPLLLFTFS